MSLFRRRALNALNTPERLEDPMKLLRPSLWALIMGLTGFSLSILIWSIFGRIPVRINGQGVLIRSDSIQRIQSGTVGRIKSIGVRVGQCVSRGTALIRIESTQLDLEREKNANQLKLLLIQDKRESLISAKREDELQAHLTRVQKLSEIGGISKDDLGQRQQQLTNARLEIENRKNHRQFQIQGQRNKIRNIEKTILSTAIVRAPQDGCVIENLIKIGEVVHNGSNLIELESINTSMNLQSLAYFKAGDGKRLKVGQRVQITPSSTKIQRHGGIEGKVHVIRSLPVTEEALNRRLGNPAWLKSLSSKTEGPMIEVITTLKKKPSSLSGYDWGNANGPNLRLSPGTPTVIRVLVEERRPISYLIPILRDLSGIY